jgi:hypothetical protein
MKVAWDILVKNNKSEEINLFLQDQIPLSYSEEVVISLDEKSGATHNDKTGFLSWKLIIKPHFKKELKYNYVIKYPKDYILSNIW